MPYFNIVAETSENTVVTEYEPVKKRSDSYQSEAQLEQEFIRLLCEQGYEYLPIHTEKDLIGNLRKKLEELNNYQFPTQSGMISSKMPLPIPMSILWKRPERYRRTMFKF